MSEKRQRKKRRLAGDISVLSQSKPSKKKKQPKPEPEIKIVTKQVGAWGEVHELIDTQIPFVYDFVHPYVGQGGGWANGKTFALCRKALVVAELAAPIPIMLGQVTEGQIHRSLLPEFAKAFLGANATVSDIETHPAVKRFLKKNLTIELKSGSTILFFPVGERNKGTAMVEKLQSATFGWIGLDQADNMNEEVFLYLQGRNRHKNLIKRKVNGRNVEEEFKNQFAITYNPEGYNHWIYKYFIRRDPDLVGELGHWYQSYEYSSEEACLAPKEQRIKWANMPASFSDRFYHGKWGAFTDQVYKEWDKDIHRIFPFRVPNGWDWFLVFDYGYVAPSCFHLYAVTRRCDETPDIPEGYAFCVWERYESGFTPEEHARAVLPVIYGTDPKQPPRVIKNMWADPSIMQTKSKGETIADEYSEHGLDFEPAINDQFLGVERMQSMLQLRPERVEDVNKILSTVYKGDRYVPKKIFESGAPALMFFNNVDKACDEIPSIRASDYALREGRGMYLKEQQRDHAADVARYFCAQFMEEFTPEEVRAVTERWRRIQKSRVKRRRACRIM